MKEIKTPDELELFLTNSIEEIKESNKQQIEKIWKDVDGIKLNKLLDQFGLSPEQKNAAAHLNSEVFRIGNQKITELSQLDKFGTTEKVNAYFDRELKVCKSAEDLELLGFKLQLLVSVKCNVEVIELETRLLFDNRKKELLEAINNRISEINPTAKEDLTEEEKMKKAMVDAFTAYIHGDYEFFKSYFNALEKNQIHTFTRYIATEHPDFDTIQMSEMFRFYN